MENQLNFFIFLKTFFKVITMNKELTEEIGYKWFEIMWSKPDLELANEIVDPQYNPSWIHIDAVGPAQVKHEIKYFRSLFPDLTYKIVDMIGLADKVWIRYKASATHQGRGWGFEATNKRVEFEGATILYINSKGKVYDRWGAFCFYDIFAELGTVPPFHELSKYLSDFKQ